MSRLQPRHLEEGRYATEPSVTIYITRTLKLPLCLGVYNKRWKKCLGRLVYIKIEIQQRKNYATIKKGSTVTALLTGSKSSCRKMTFATDVLVFNGLLIC